MDVYHSPLRTECVLHLPGTRGCTGVGLALRLRRTLWDPVIARSRTRRELPTRRSRNGHYPDRSEASEGGPTKMKAQAHATADGVRDSERSFSWRPLGTAIRRVPTEKRDSL